MTKQIFTFSKLKSGFVILNTPNILQSTCKLHWEPRQNMEVVSQGGFIYRQNLPGTMRIKKWMIENLKCRMDGGWLDTGDWRNERYIKDEKAGDTGDWR